MVGRWSRGFDSRPFGFQITSTYRQVVHARVPLSMALMPYSWEGNRRSGVALAMRHRLQRFIHLRAHRLRKGDQHPSTLLYGLVRHPLLARQAEGRQDLCSAAVTFCFMVALWNRETIYIFMLWFVLLLFFPRLISAAADWMFTILWHMVWP